MSIVGDNVGDVTELAVLPLVGLGWQITALGDTKPPIPPCIIVQWPRAVQHLGMLGGDCPEWAWEVDLLVVAGNTMTKDLPAMQYDVMSALHKAGVRTTAEPRNYNRPDDPAPLPAVLITCT